MREIILASSNQGKLRELQAMLAPLSIEVISQTSLDVKDVPETGLTFVENALIKARNAAKITGKAALADDSGLEVLSLGGAPGIYSARYAGSNAKDEDNNNKLLQELSLYSDLKERKANFRCCLVLLRHEQDPCPIIAEGVWSGHIAKQAIGENGFGYDPLFIPDGFQISSAQLEKEEKNQISHRALAMKTLVQQLNKTIGLH